MVGINNGEPRSIFQINWDRGYCSQEKVVVLEDLFIRLRSQHVNGTLGYKNAVSLVGARSRHVRTIMEVFLQTGYCELELAVLNNAGCSCMLYSFWTLAMAKAQPLKNNSGP